MSINAKPWKPFLKWVGGKGQLLDEIEKICQKTGYSANDFQIPDDEAAKLKTKIEQEKPIRKPRSD